LNVAFLKFSRNDEYQADQAGAQIMARAGYDPVAMASFFEMLRSEQGGDPGKLERLFSSHPPSGDRETRIREQARSLQVAKVRDVGGFDRMRADLAKRSPSSSAQVAQQWEQPQSQDTRDDRGRFVVRVDQPSSRYQRFEQSSGFFGIDHPDNWRAYASDAGGYAVSIAPDGGVVDTGDGQQAMLYGVIVNHYAPFESDEDRRRESLQRSYAPFEDTDRWRGSLEDATDDLVRQIIRTNSYLRAQDGHARRNEVDGAASYSVELSGRSPITGQDERVTVVTRGVSDGHVIYALSVVPSSGRDAMARTFERMLGTLTVHAGAFHGTQTGSNLRR
jgi:hypothetical protein